MSLFTVYEESSVDSHWDDYHYDYRGPPPGNLNSFYDHTQEVLASEAIGSGSENKNLKKEISEKHVEEVVVPVEDPDEEYKPEEVINTQDHMDSFPDGGLQAWLIILGTSFSAFSSFGLCTSWGVFQAYYEEEALKQHSPSTIAWIGSAQYALVLLPALLSGYWFDLGVFKLPFFGASILVVTCTFLVGQCTHYWQFLLCQGVGVGIGCGMVFGPAMGIIGQWFKRKHGLAMGITVLGSSIGGTVFPIVVQKLIPRVGFPWTMRIFGFILLLALVIPNLTLRRRLPPKNVAGGLGGIFNFAAFKNLPFLTYAAAVVAAFLGLYTVSTYIVLSALAAGVSRNMAFYLITIANASSGLGAIVTGIIVDEIGPINFIAPTTLLAAALSFAWPFAKTESSLIVMAVLYGFTCGSFISGILLPIIELGDGTDTGRRTGMIMSIGAVGALCGIPISGAINKATGRFEIVGCYAGSVIVVSVIFMLITRHLVLGRLWGRF